MLCGMQTSDAGHCGCSLHTIHTIHKQVCKKVDWNFSMVVETTITRNSRKKAMKLIGTIANLRE